MIAFGLLMTYANGQEQKAELVVQTGHSEAVNKVAVTSDGKLLASGSDDGTIKLWDVSLRRELRTFAGEFSRVVSAAFSADGKMLAGVGNDKIKVWSVETGSELLSITHQSKVKLREAGESYVNNDLTSVVFSPDGKTLVTAGGDGKIKFWSIATKAEIKTLSGHSTWLSEAVFSRDGKLLATSSGDKTVAVWEVETGKKLHVLKGHSHYVYGLAFNHDGSLLASGSEDKTARVWNVTTGKELKTLTGHATAVADVMFLHGENTLVTGSDDRTLKLWNAATGESIKTLSGFSGAISSLVVSPDNRTIISGSFDNLQISFWDVESGKSDVIYTGSHKTTRVEFSPDDKKLATVYVNRIKIWDLSGGNHVNIDVEQGGYFSPTAFSRDGTKIAAGAGNPIVQIFDVATGKEIQTFTHPHDVSNVSFNADGSLLVGDTYTAEGKIFFTVWDAATGVKRLSTSDLKEVEKLIPDFYVSDLGKKKAIKSGGKLRAEVVNEKTTIFDNQTNVELCRLLQFGKNDWIVVTPDGLFDGSPNAWNNLYWRLDGKTFAYAPVAAFFKEFYFPGLLPEIMQLRTPKPPDRNVSEIDIRQPSAKITLIANQKTTEQFDGRPRVSSANLAQREAEVTIEITENNGAKRIEKHPATSGAYDARLFRNGSLVKHWQGDVFDRQNGCEQINRKADEPKKAICQTTVTITAGDNEFSAYAFNHENVKSNDFRATVTGADSLKRKGKLNIVSIGINEYANANHNLKFAVPDAVDFGAQMRKQQINLDNFEAPENIQLTNAEATKQNIIYALERFSIGSKARKPEKFPAALEERFARIEKTQPEDVLVIYFAGHGTAARDRFYLIPHDGFPVTEPNAEARNKLLLEQSVSDLELESVLKGLDAGQILLIIDACNSGQALESEEKRRGPMNSRGLAQLAYEKGMYILTAAQSFQAALEVTRTAAGRDINHGLLTYSLLEGLTTAKADGDADRKTTDREWLDYAVGQVPLLQREAMKQRSSEIKQTGRGAQLVFSVGNDSSSMPEAGDVQTPRVFYRRESNASPLIIAQP